MTEKRHLMQMRFEGVYRWYNLCCMHYRIYEKGVCIEFNVQKQKLVQRNNNQNKTYHFY
jgi:hypothetical protein